MEPPAVRSDRGSSSEKKNDPRGNNRRPSRPTKTPPPAAKVEPPKPAAPAAPITTDSPSQKPAAPYVAQTAASTPAPAPIKPQPPKPAPVEKKELGAPDFQRIRSAIETGLSAYRGIASFKTMNRKNQRDRTLDAIFSAAGEAPRAGDRFAAAKRLARQAGGEELLQMVMDLHKN